MANIREISGRIRSIQDTMKITNAMYMISSTKLRKAKKNQENNQPYFDELTQMMRYITSHVPGVQNQYLDPRFEKKGKDRTRAIICITADKGLAGAFNHNVLKLAEAQLEEDISCKLYVVGEVGRQYFAGKKVIMAGQFQYTAQNPTLHRARVIAETILEEFLTGQVDEVCLIYTGMVNSISSTARLLKILPLDKELLGTGETEPEDKGAEDDTLTFVPSADQVLNNIVPDILVGTIYSALVESFCSEQNDRMLAMDAANQNAQAMIRELSIEYNRVRQALITQEITEVIAGAKAQKKKKKRKEALGS